MKSVLSVTCEVAGFVALIAAAFLLGLVPGFIVLGVGLIVVGFLIDWLGSDVDESGSTSA